MGHKVGAQHFKHEVVIKRLFPHIAESPEAVATFEREAEVLARLTHPALPHVYDFGRVDGAWFIAMEFIRGYSLKQLQECLARSEGQWTLAAVLSIAHQLALALSHVHEREGDGGLPLAIVHCDVAPRNVLVTADGYVKLLDFGVSQTRLHEQPSGLIRGTLRYAAPEQIRGCKVDARADVFSVGVIMYELLSGLPLFQGEPAQVATQIVEHAIPPLSSINGAIPASASDVVMHALEKEPAHRTPDASRLADALEEAAVGLRLSLSSRSLSCLLKPLHLRLAGVQEVSQELVASASARSPSTADAARGRNVHDSSFSATLSRLAQKSRRQDILSGDLGEIHAGDLRSEAGSVVEAEIDELLSHLEEPGLSADEQAIRRRPEDMAASGALPYPMKRLQRN